MSVNAAELSMFVRNDDDQVHQGSLALTNKKNKQTWLPKMPSEKMTEYWEIQLI